MAIGNPVDSGALNARLGDVAVGLRDANYQAVQLWAYVASLGVDEASQVTGLQALGFTANDAQTFWTKANNAFASAQVYYGIITQPGTFNYDAALAGVRGGT